MIWCQDFGPDTAEPRSATHAGQCQELTPDTIELPKKPDPATTEPSEKLFLSKTCFE